MKINIYYGGRGLIGDPTLYVINKMRSVLEELNVTVERYDLYESKNSITTLPNTLKMQTVLFLQVLWNGTVLAGICKRFLMPAGCTRIRRSLPKYICVLS